MFWAFYLYIYLIIYIYVYIVINHAVSYIILVDYVLTYHVQKTPTSVRRQPSRSFARSMRDSLMRSFRRTRQTPDPQEDPEIAAQEHQSDYHEDDQNFRREEFEENLREMGLELERDEGVSGTF